MENPQDEGYYWVRNYHGWSIAYWDGSWSVCGNDETYYTSDFDEIGEKVERTHST